MNCCDDFGNCTNGENCPVRNIRIASEKKTLSKEKTCTKDHIDLTMLHLKGQDAFFKNENRVLAIVDPTIAKRLFACWNACKGISTQSIVENGVVSFEFVTKKE